MSFKNSQSRILNILEIRISSIVESSWWTFSNASESLCVTNIYILLSKS